MQKMVKNMKALRESEKRSLSKLVHGTLVGWTTPIISKINNKEIFYLTNDQISWMISILFIGNILSPIPSGKLMDRIGRKRTLILMSFISIISWIILLKANGPTSIYIARFIGGLYCGTVTTVLPVYNAEIAEPQLRGALTGMIYVIGSVGITLQFAIGPLVSYEILTGFNLIINIILVLTFPWVPESPYWYLMKSNKSGAAKSLAWFRHKTEDEVTEELLEIEKGLNEQNKNGNNFRELIATKGNRTALFLVILLSFTQRMSGNSSLTSYAITILPDLKFLTAQSCVSIMGVTWTIFCFVSTFLTDCFNRRPLILYGTFGCGIVTGLAGLWYYLDTKTTVNVRAVNWLPMALFIAYGFTSAIGSGPICMTIISEYFSANNKAYGCGIASIVLAASSVLATKLWFDITNLFGLHYNFVMFSCSSFICYVYCLFYLIESKGKTLNEIQSQLQK